MSAKLEKNEFETRSNIWFRFATFLMRWQRSERTRYRFELVFSPTSTANNCVGLANRKFQFAIESMQKVCVCVLCIVD